jgi:hypothetical protein
VGEVGGGTRQEQLALGETPNLAHRPPAPAGDSHHAARLADGAAGPPRHGEEPGATRGDARARVFV